MTETLTLWKRLTNWAENNKVLVVCSAAIVVVILLAEFTDAVRTLFSFMDSFSGLDGASGNLSDCLAEANGILERVSKCYAEFP